MFGTGDGFLRGLLLCALGLVPQARAETPNSPYPDHPGVGNSKVEISPSYYQDIIAKNGTPKGDLVDGLIDVSTIDPSQVDPRFRLAPDGSTHTGPSNTWVDSAQKLTDASGLAREGKRASTAQALHLSLNLGTVIQQSSGPYASIPQSQVEKFQKAMNERYQNAKSMEAAEFENLYGSRRLRYDPSDGANAKAPGTETTESDAKLTPRTFAKAVVDQMPEATKKAFEAKGVDLVEATERLLTAEQDGTDAQTLMELFGFQGTVTEGDGGEGARDLFGVDALARKGNDDGSGSAGAGRGLAAKGRDGAADGETEPKPDYRLAGIPFVLGPADAQGRRGLRTQPDIPEGEGYVKSKDGKKLQRLTVSQYYGLMAQGVLVPRHRQTIFSIAHRQYREYGRWRGASTRVAAR